MIDPVQIKRPDVVEDVRALAELLGVSLTEAIGKAVRTQLALEKVKTDAKLAERRKRSAKALAEFRRLPVVGPRLTDRDLYDAEGLPK